MESPNKSDMFFWMRRSVVVVLAGTALLTASSACDNTANGDRCNPYLSHDECANAPTYQCVPSLVRGGNDCVQWRGLLLRRRLHGQCHKH